MSGPEALFSARVKKGLKNCYIERLENRVNLGIPDMLIGIGNRFVALELKVVQSGYKIGLRPHQVSFFLRHSSHNRPCFLLVLWKSSASREESIVLYDGLEIVNIADMGLRVDPIKAWPSKKMPWEELEYFLLSDDYRLKKPMA